MFHVLLVSNHARFLIKEGANPALQLIAVFQGHQTTELGLGTTL